MNGLKRRAMGIETEYGSEFSAEGAYDNSDRVFFSNRLKERLGMINDFVINGSRIYLCTSGSHPEYSTPECDSPFLAALYNVAGQKVLFDLFGDKYNFFKLNRDSERNFFGSHENYSVDMEIFDSRKGFFKSSFIPFSVTRQIYAGSGFIDKGKFQISQRADAIEEEDGTDTTSNRPIWFSGGKQNYGKDLHRLHLLFGDSNMLEPVIEMKLATTCMLLDMVESGWSFSFDFQRKTPEIQKAISRDLSLRDRYRVNSFKITSPEGIMDKSANVNLSSIDIQRFYVEMAKEFYGKDVNDKTAHYLERWEGIIDALEQDPDSLIGRLEWVTKKHFLEGVEDPELELEHWHNVNPRDSKYYFLRENGLVDCIFTNDEIEYAVEHPPVSTRAYARGECLRYLFENKLKLSNSNVNWENVGKLKLPDPLDNSLPENFENLM